MKFQLISINTWMKWVRQVCVLACIFLQRFFLQVFEKGECLCMWDKRKVNTVYVSLVVSPASACFHSSHLTAEKLIQLDADFCWILNN